VDQASVGDKVRVPEGDFVFNIDPNKTFLSWAYGPMPVGVVVPGGVDIIGAGKGKTILRMTEVAPGRQSNMFVAYGAVQERVNLLNMTLIGNPGDDPGYPVNTGVLIATVPDFRVGHCEFINFSHSAIRVMPFFYDGISRGVVDHCDFDNPWKDAYPGWFDGYGYGVGIQGRDEWEDITTKLGKYETTNNVVYVENCTFRRNRHAITSNRGGWYVSRYNDFFEPVPISAPLVDIHGGVGASIGGRGAEIYNNKFYGAGSGYGSAAINYRGGGGVAFNNNMIRCQYGVMMSVEPSPNPLCVVSELYVWNNEAVEPYIPYYPLWIDGVYVEEQDYFLHEPVGYKRYAYPHPLTTQPKLAIPLWLIAIPILGFILLKVKKKV